MFTCELSGGHAALDANGEEMSAWRLLSSHIRYKLGPGKLVEDKTNIVTRNISEVILRSLGEEKEQSLIRTRRFDVLGLQEEFKSAFRNYKQGDKRTGSIGWCRTEEITFFYLHL